MPAKKDAAYYRDYRARKAATESTPADRRSARPMVDAPVVCEMGGPHENCEHAAYKARTDEMIRGIQNMTQHQRDEILAKIAPPRRSSH